MRDRSKPRRDFVSGDAAAGDGAADGFFVEVCCGGVNVAVACGEGVADDAFRFRGVYLVHPES